MATTYRFVALLVVCAAELACSSSGPAAAADAGSTASGGGPGDGAASGDALPSSGGTSSGDASSGGTSGGTSSGGIVAPGTVTTCTTSDALPDAHDAFIAAAVVGTAPSVWLALQTNSLSFEPYDLRRYTLASGAGCVLQRDAAFTAAPLKSPLAFAADAAGQIWAKVIANNRFELHRFAPGPPVRCTLEGAIAAFDVDVFAIAPDGKSGFAVVSEGFDNDTLSKVSVTASACTITALPKSGSIPMFNYTLAIDAQGRAHWAETFAVSIFDAAGSFVKAYSLGGDDPALKALVPCAGGMCAFGQGFGSNAGNRSYACSADGACTGRKTTVSVFEARAAAGTPTTSPFVVNTDHAAGAAGPYKVSVLAVGP